ncbi:MAG: 2-amino-4-hydroxy-6-hydroxymethyldihydropteridine diphosphokinase, partial [Muribaculaceae bacterium]|nr:2-amino-4-hydroxy-6-hydroxymethyldihydropteridine diphosphokinase [Muribaculaceae bacterium]
MRIHLNIGSNLGRRHTMLSDAVAAIRRAWPEAAVSVSEPMESEPWGYDSPHPFLNIGVMLVLPAPVQPEAVLDTLQDIERTLGHGAPHRNADGSYRDRPLDIDIIDIDGMQLHTPRLTLPHP